MQNFLSTKCISQLKTKQNTFINTVKNVAGQSIMLPAMHWKPAQKFKKKKKKKQNLKSRLPLLNTLLCTLYQML